MANSFITRRIDELGRIVIPKEIRMNLGIHTGEPLEINIVDKSVVIKKFSHIDNIKSVINDICTIIGEIGKVDLMITDRDKIISTTKNLKDYQNNNIPIELKMLVQERKGYNSKEKDDILGLNKLYYIEPIITSTDCNGLVILIMDNINDEKKAYLKLVQKLIESYLDVA